jgi:hypothetical protein
LKNTSKISSIFTAFLAFVILFVATTSGLQSHAITTKKDNTAENSSKKTDTDSKYYFSKTTIEAVFSQIATDFQCAEVIFLATEFKFLSKEVHKIYLSIFERKIHLEILFEHLSAPNAP